jgi:excisionase family DNA binding protein
MTLLTVRDVAAMLRVSERTVRQYVANNTIPYIKANGLLRFDRDDIAKWLSDGSNEKQVD